MDFKRFKKTLDAIRDIDVFMDGASKLGINMIETPLYDSLTTIYKGAFVDSYGEDGFDWIMWYLYEKPNMVKKDTDGKEIPNAWDHDGKPIDTSTDEAIWSFLEKQVFENNTEIKNLEEENV